MIAALIITVCAWGAAPDDAKPCETFRIPTAPMTMQQCLKGGQIAAIKWLSEHPYFEFHTLRRYRCETGERA